jgi:hypothetical protein
MVAHLKITDDEVRAIRAAFDGSNFHALAERFGISKSYVAAIAYYRNRVAAGPPRESVHYYISDGVGGRPKGLRAYSSE